MLQDHHVFTSLIKKLKKTFLLKVLDIFESGYFPSEFSVNENIKKLKAGQILEFDEKGLIVKNYWNSNTIKTNYSFKEKDEEKILDELDSLLQLSKRKNDKRRSAWSLFIWRHR